MNIPTINLSYKNLLMVTALLASILTATSTASPTDSTRTIKLEKHDQSRPATKLEIITAVKRTYRQGRILSVRKDFKAYNHDCHNVKIIDKNNELLLIRVGCN